MKTVSLACAGVVMLFAAGVLLAQQDGAPPQGDGRPATEKEELDTLKPVERELFTLKKKEAEKKAEYKEATEKAEVQRVEWQAQMARPPEKGETREAWQEKVREQEGKYRALKKDADMKGLRSNELEDEVGRFRNRHPDAEANLPDWAKRRIAQVEKTPVPPQVPQRPSAPIDFKKGHAYEQLEAIKRLGAGGDTVIIDGGKKLPDISHQPRAGQPGDPFPVQAPKSVERPAPPVELQPKYENESRELKTITKPGGVIITATAEIAGLRPEDVASASFDSSSGLLTLALHSGKKLSIELNRDDFAIAVRCIFDRQVDPSLALSYSRKNPGYKAVSYTGPLHNTQFGLIMLEADKLLGAILFNREGNHRPVAAAAIPHFADLACEADRTRKAGSRVFLRANAARLAVERDQLVYRGIQVKVDVEGMDYEADYYQEALHRLARAMDQRFDLLADKFLMFSEFRRLTVHVALAKWLKRHAISFDWTALKAHEVTKVEVPGEIPAVDVGCLFNGRNLDGWRLNLPARHMEYTVESGRLRLKPTGNSDLKFLSSTWSRAYDLIYSVKSEGPVEFIIRDMAGKETAAITIDTKGAHQEIELFMRNGKWEAVAPRIHQKGGAEEPEPKKGEPRKPADFGIRVPPGSTLTLYAASLRTW